MFLIKDHAATVQYGFREDLISITEAQTFYP